MSEVPFSRGDSTLVGLSDFVSKAISWGQILAFESPVRKESPIRPFKKLVSAFLLDPKP